VAHAILDRIGTARMLIDFYRHDEDARQRGGGSNHPGGQFARTLDAHGAVDSPETAWVAAAAQVFWVL